MNNPNNRIFRRFAIPFIIWMTALALAPLLVMIFLSFITSEGVSFSIITPTLDNFIKLGEPSIAIAFWNSIKYAGIATILCGIIGYIIAYIVFCSKKIKNKFLILTIFLLPMWSNLLLRTNALKSLLQPNNMITNLLDINGLNLSGTGFAVIIGLVITYLPFMILPIYSALEKIDYNLQEASQDLGVDGIKKFWKVIFPLSSKGIFTGSILVFLPCASGFAVPKILGEGNIVLIGNIIENSINYMDYNLGSLLAIIILIVILGFLLILSKIDSKGETLI